MPRPSSWVKFVLQCNLVFSIFRRYCDLIVTPGCLQSTAESIDSTMVFFLRNLKFNRFAREFPSDKQKTYYLKEPRIRRKDGHSIMHSNFHHGSLSVY